MGKGNILLSVRGIRIKSYGERNFIGKKKITLKTVVLRSNILINSYLKRYYKTLHQRLLKKLLAWVQERSMSRQIWTISLSKELKERKVAEVQIKWSDY